MTRIVWLSRHKPLEKQVRELERLFGPVELLHDSESFTTADRIVEKFRRSGAQEMVIVAPLSVIDQLVQRGIRPLYAEMTQVHDGLYDVAVNGRKFIFQRFTRIVGIKIEKEELSV